MRKVSEVAGNGGFLSPSPEDPMSKICRWYNGDSRRSLNSLRLGEARDDQQDDSTHTGTGRAGRLP